MTIFFPIVETIFLGDDLDIDGHKKTGEKTLSIALNIVKRN